MSTISSPSQGKSWWSRSKSSKDLPSLRSNRSATSLSEKSVSNGNSKSKDPSSGSRFNTFVATAIGKKSKKPTLTIQDPPSPLPTVQPPIARSRSGSTNINVTPLHSPNSPRRHPPDSASSVRRYYDIDEASDPHTISEPRTPSDHPRDRSSYQNSVMTLSDPDPFASGGVMFSPFVQEPNRLSVYSDSSLLDPASKRSDTAYNNRVSYGSSSSNSHNHSSENQVGRFQLPTSVGKGQTSRPPSVGRKSHRSQLSNGQEEISRVMLPNQALARTRSGHMTSAGSSSSHSTVTADRNGQGGPPSRNVHTPLVRSNPSTLRMRGMTVAGASDRRPSTATGALGYAAVSGAPSIVPLNLRRKASDTFSGKQSPSTSHSPISFSRTRSSSSATSYNSPTIYPGSRPVVLVRKASSPRLIVPPPSAAPPSSELPPPPPPSAVRETFLDSIDDLSSHIFPEPPSSRSSSLSFASGIDLSIDDSRGDAIYHLMRGSFGDDENVFGNGLQRSLPGTARNMNTVSSLPPPKTHSPVGMNDGGQSKALKKAISQQNLLGKRYSETSLVSSIASGSGSHDDQMFGTPGTSSSVLKNPRKQRSFHHPRIALPPLPLPSLRHANSYNTSSTDTPSSFQSPSASDQRKGVSSPPQTRKRLFSGSSLRRNSSSQPPPSPSISTEDDIRSFVSVDSEVNVKKERRSKPIMMSFSNFGNQFSLVTENACIAPAWDDQYNDTASKRGSQSEYIPQHIMSPAAMLKLEEQLTAESAQRDMERERAEREQHEEEKITPKLQLEAKDLGFTFASRKPKSTRSRSNSILSEMSTSTLAFGPAGGSSIYESLYSPASPVQRSPTKNEQSGLSIARDHSRLPFRSSSMLAKPLSKVPSLSARPSTAQPSLTPPASPITATPRPSTALPPPPRPRTSRNHSEKEKEVNSSFKRMSFTPIHPLSPPPRRKTSRAVTVIHEERDRPTHPSHPPSSFDQHKTAQNKSIVRRPSFLEIEDDVENEMGDSSDAVEVNPSGSPIMESSFLDLDRGDSFDTVRSYDEDLQLF